jgi:hypothetical protein
MKKLILILIGAILLSIAATKAAQADCDTDYDSSDAATFE